MATLSRGTVVVAAERYVASWADTVAETVATEGVVIRAEMKCAAILDSSTKQCSCLAAWANVFPARSQPTN